MGSSSTTRTRTGLPSARRSAAACSLTAPLAALVRRFAKRCDTCSLAALAHRDHANQPRARGCASDGVLLCASCVSACGQPAERNRRCAGSVWSPTDSGRGPMTETDSPVFSGWPAEATAFLAELADDNTRTFWTENAHRYRAALREPTRALAAALTPEFGPPRVFRPYVDRRFRPNADPYRTDTGITVAGPGGTPYVAVLSAQGLAVQVGHQVFDAGQLPPLPGGRGRAGGGGARRGAGCAAPRRPRARRCPCAGPAAARLPGGPPTAAVAPVAWPARRPRVAGGRVAEHGGAAPAGRGGLAGRAAAGRLARGARRATRAGRRTAPARPTLPPDDRNSAAEQGGDPQVE